MQVRALLICFTLLGLLGSTVPVASAALITTAFGTGYVNLSLPIEPQLQVEATVDPDSTVRVIVQKTSATVSSADVIKRGGGRLVEDFGVIPAFVADFRHGDVMALATNPSVRYVSLNSIVKRKAVTTTYAPAVGAPTVWNATNGAGPLAPG